MKPTLKSGLTHRFTYVVPENKTVPYTYPEAPEIASMPKVFATGNMIILMEWVCAQLLAPHLDPGRGQSRRACRCQPSGRDAAGNDGHRGRGVRRGGRTARVLQGESP